MHLGVGHKSYKAHKTSLALMLLALALFVVAALLPLSANIFAVLGECQTAYMEGSVAWLVMAVLTQEEYGIASGG